jgi:hypothetical protein
VATEEEDVPPPAAPPLLWPFRRSDTGRAELPPLFVVVAFGSLEDAEDNGAGFCALMLTSG